MQYRDGFFGATSGPGREEGEGKKEKKGEVISAELKKKEEERKGDIFKYLLLHLISNERKKKEKEKQRQFNIMKEEKRTEPLSFPPYKPFGFEKREKRKGEGKKLTGQGRERKRKTTFLPSIRIYTEY